MGILNSVKRGIQSPTDLLREYFRMGIRVNIWASKFQKNDSYPIMDGDWDNLIILDGCRYDAFIDQIGQAQPITSAGSESWEFMKEYFIGRTFHDTVYVTSNPHVNYLDNDVFHDVVSLLGDEYWDNEAKTVRPQVVTDQALKTSEKYPNKRLIIHYMQPHYPFLGPAGQDIDIELGRNISDPDNAVAAYNIWYDMRLEGISKEKLIKAYRENLEVAWPAVKQAIEGLVGKSVVTADHGNGLGELLLPVPMPVYGHPRHLNHFSVRRVPWAEYPSDTRKQIIDDPPTLQGEIGDDVVERRLQDLGYV